MTTSTVEFWGGPADGTVLVMWDERPPPRYAVLTTPAVSALLTTEPGAVDPIELPIFRYRREPNALPDGPLWRYVPDDL